MPTELTILNAPAKNHKVNNRRRDADSRRSMPPIGICVELIDLCAKVTGRIDPAIGSIVGYARDEAFSQAPEYWS